MRIVYVENHEVFAANVIRQFLSQHSVTVVPSLSAARQALETGSFDLLLVDYDLDDGKGDELVRELTATGKALAVIGSHLTRKATLPCCGQARWPFAARCSSTGFKASSIP